MRRRTLSSMWWIWISAAFAARGFGADTMVPATVSDTGYTSAFTCGRCHTDIFNSWKRSMHAFSLSDPVFEVSYMQVLKEAPSEAGLCLRCHAPVTLENGDVDLVQGITREGVTCDFCHTVTAVHLGNSQRPYTQDLGRTKRSTMAKANSPAHDVAYSELHSRSEFCGGCHQFESRNGTVVMGTYEEWKNGPYAAEGKPCQSCHMALSEGHVVRTEIKKSASRMNLHDLIHDAEQLKSAVDVRITETMVVKDGINVTVEIANVGSGHMIPTGIPNRVLTLRVDVITSSGNTVRKEKEYRKILAGPDGRLLEFDYQAFLYAESVISDNRIGPRETRTEHFRFDLDGRRANEVSAVAIYEYEPLVLDKRPMVVTMSSDSRTLRR